MKSGSEKFIIFPFQFWAGVFAVRSEQNKYCAVIFIASILKFTRMLAHPGKSNHSIISRLQAWYQIVYMNWAISLTMVLTI